MEPVQHTPFISPLEPLPHEDELTKARVRPNLLVVIFIVILIAGLGALTYKAILP